MVPRGPKTSGSGSTTLSVTILCFLVAVSSFVAYDYRVAKNTGKKNCGKGECSCSVPCYFIFVVCIFLFRLLIGIAEGLINKRFSHLVFYWFLFSCWKCYFEPFLLVQITYPAVQSQAGERRGDVQPGGPACGAPLRPAPQQFAPRRRQISWFRRPVAAPGQRRFRPGTRRLGSGSERRQAAQPRWSG
jgi:hypothetical protein